MLAALAACVCAAFAPAAADARDPGRWVLTGASSIPTNYWQGLTSDPPSERVFFVGVFEGLWRTTPACARPPGTAPRSPPTSRPPRATTTSATRPGTGDGGRVLLPMECYYAGRGRQHLRHGRVRGRRPGHARLALLRQARPGRDPQGDVGRELAGRHAGLDQQRRRPARLSLRATITAANAGPAAAPIRASTRASRGRCRRSG